jgi:hypothetical protein
MAPKQRSPAMEILAALDADPALIEHYDPNEIETIPLALIQARLIELGLRPTIPLRLHRLILEPMPSPAADVLRVLADDVDSLQLQRVEVRPLAEVTACLQRRGTNYGPGVAAIIDFVGERASASVGLDQSKVSSIKSAKLQSRKSIFLASIGLAVTATAAVAATVGFFVTREARQDKVIAAQRYEIQELGDQVQGLKTRLKEIGADDFISLTMWVPLSNPLAGRTWPVQSDDRTASAAGVGVAPAAQDRDSAIIAQKAVLTEGGAQFVGSAVWRTISVASDQEQKPDVVVRAEIEIPDRFSIRWSLWRNTLEIAFTLPHEFPHFDISNVPGILMKYDEATHGVPLNGTGDKVGNNLFLIRLSSTEIDMQRNVELLRERSWFDIPIVYGDGARAIVALEKGASGEQAFENAFMRWGDAKDGK